MDEHGKVFAALQLPGSSYQGEVGKTWTQEPSAACAQYRCQWWWLEEVGVYSFGPLLGLFIVSVYETRSAKQSFCSGAEGGKSGGFVTFKGHVSIVVAFGAHKCWSVGPVHRDVPQAMPLLTIVGYWAAPLSFPHPQFDHLRCL